VRSARPTDPHFIELTPVSGGDIHSGRTRDVRSPTTLLGDAPGTADWAAGIRPTAWTESPGVGDSGVPEKVLGSNCPSGADLASISDIAL
jgi:hypothetical protein